MRLPRTLVIATALLLLAACQRNEAPVTGAYGSQMLSGVVTMAAGMPNGSPAGMRVAVGGTGMSAVLGPDGRFSFFNVPETTNLIFSREDVNASIRVVPSIAPLTIELNSNSAHLGRHRATPQGPQLQIEGTIVSVSDTQLVVQPENPSKSPVTFVITSTTAIYQGDTALKPSDLTAGEQVHVKAAVSGTTNTASIVIVQNDNNSGDTNPGQGSQTMTANGTVTAAASGQITVSTEAHGDVVVKGDNSSTVVRMEGSVIQFSDIKVGWQVNCLGTRIDDHTLQATQIEVRGVSDHP